MSTIISKNLETIRMLWGFTIEEMAHYFKGVEKETYRSYERARRRVDVDMMCELEELTGIPVIRLHRETLHMKELPDKPLRRRRYSGETDVGNAAEDSAVYQKLQLIEKQLSELKNVLATH